MAEVRSEIEEPARAWDLYVAALALDPGLRCRHPMARPPCSAAQAEPALDALGETVRARAEQPRIALLAG
jgi:hypothetical protein